MSPSLLDHLSGSIEAAERELSDLRSTGYQGMGITALLSGNRASSSTWGNRALISRVPLI
jgi:hypothetical protein